MQTDARHVIGGPVHWLVSGQIECSLRNVNREDAIQVKSGSDRRLSRICELYWRVSQQDLEQMGMLIVAVPIAGSVTSVLLTRIRAERFERLSC
jgi:hypothetical protein